MMKFYNRLYDCLNGSPQDFKRELKAALAQGFPIDLQSIGGQTLLFESIWWEYPSKAGIPETLLDHGADPNIGDKDDNRPLAVSIFTYRPLKLARRLINAGADVNAQDKDGTTAFFWAARKYLHNDRDYGLSAVQLLLEHGADPYLCDVWMKAHANDTEEQTARRRELQELCDAYLTKRDKTRRREAINDVGAFMR